MSKKKEEISLPEKYIFFPLQVRIDSVAKLENLDSLDVLEEAIRIAEEKKIHLVVKRHPWCSSAVVKNTLSRMQSKYEYFLTTNANVHDIIQNAHSIIACNSGVSLEALIADKPVYCFGESEWYEATNKIEKLEDVKNAFDDNPKRMDDFQKKIVAYLLSSYWVRVDDYKAISKKIDYCIGLYDDEWGVDLNDQEKVIEDIAKSIVDMENARSLAERKSFEMYRDYNRLKKQNRYNIIYNIRNLIYKIFKV